MAVVPVVLDTVLRCKICASPERATIDRLIAEWKSRLLTKAELLEKMGELGIVNPNIDNVKLHTGTTAKPKHVRFDDSSKAAKNAEDEAAAKQKILDGLQERIASGEKLDANMVLDTIIAHGMADLELRVAGGEKSGVTIDQVLKAVGEKTKRKHSETQDQLLHALTGGISLAFKTLDKGEQLPALNAGEFDAEEVVVEADDAD